LFFDIIKPRKIENLQSDEPFSSDPYFSSTGMVKDAQEIVDDLPYNNQKEFTVNEC
jgi:hypothetical protein